MIFIFFLLSTNAKPTVNVSYASIVSVPNKCKMSSHLSNIFKIYVFCIGTNGAAYHRQGREWETIDTQSNTVLISLSMGLVNI